MYASISLLVFLTFGFAAVVYGIYALYATVTQTKEAHRRPDNDHPEQMFKFERPSISQVRTHIIDLMHRIIRAFDRSVPPMPIYRARRMLVVPRANLCLNVIMTRTREGI